MHVEPRLLFQATPFRGHAGIPLVTTSSRRTAHSSPHQTRAPANKICSGRQRPPRAQRGPAAGTSTPVRPPDADRARRQRKLVDHTLPQLWQRRQRNRRHHCHPRRRALGPSASGAERTRARRSSTPREPDRVGRPEGTGPPLRLPTRIRVPPPRLFGSTVQRHVAGAVAVVHPLNGDCDRRRG